MRFKEFFYEEFNNNPQDEEYLTVVKREDMDAVQRMVDKAARTAGYDSGIVFHGTSNRKFTVFDPAKANNQLLGTGFYFIDSERESKYYGPNTIRAYLKLGNSVSVDTNTSDAQEIDFSSFDSTVAKTPMGTVFRVANPKRIKSADPITYDDNGNIIPLSQRFDSSKDDIRY
jgi:hypothetical protein